MSYKYTGDYYAAKGDLFGGIAKFIGKAAGKLLPMVPGPIGLVAQGVRNVAGAHRAAESALQRAGSRMLATSTGSAGGRSLIPDFPGPNRLPGLHKVRHMNPLNPRALRRATRRLQSFHHKAQAALHELGYTVHRTGVAHHKGKHK